MKEAERREFLEQLDSVAEVLDLKKREAPFDVVDYVQSMRRAGLSNPLQQVFQGTVRLTAADGSQYEFRWPTPFAESVALACEVGHYPIVEAYLLASLPPWSVSDRERLQSVLVTELVARAKKVTPIRLGNGETLSLKEFNKHIKPFAKIAMEYIESHYKPITPREGRKEARAFRFEKVKA